MAVRTYPYTLQQEQPLTPSIVCIMMCAQADVVNLGPSARRGRDRGLARMG
jgi:hypothetical protein